MSGSAGEGPAFDLRRFLQNIYTPSPAALPALSDFGIGLSMVQGSGVALTRSEASSILATFERAKTQARAAHVHRALSRGQAHAKKRAPPAGEGRG